MVDWTEERVARLTLLHTDGSSASEIAKKLGPEFTKGMVAGKINRLGLTKNTARARIVQNPTKPPASKSNAPVVPKPGVPIELPKSAPLIAKRMIPTPPPTAPKGIRLYDLREGHCRWPIGAETPVRFFCGAPAVSATSWCECHMRIAFAGSRRPAQSGTGGSRLHPGATSKSERRSH